MYQVQTSSALRNTGLTARSPFDWLKVGPNVLALGVTSLLTDISSEMVTTVLPVYLVLSLGLSPLQFGIVDGLYQGTTALLRMLGGFLADRWGRHKEIAATGYLTSAVCKLGLLAAGAAWPLISLVVAIDRAGKGVRTAPRDALISLSMKPEKLALGFGVHRAFDSAGAMLGPLIALAMLLALPNRFDAVFMFSFSVAMMGVGTILIFARNAPRSTVAEMAPRLKFSAMIRQLLQLPGFGTLTAVAAILSFATISDAFLYLLLQQRNQFNVGFFPLLYVGTAGFYFLTAVSAGRLADAVGSRTTFLGGYVLLGFAYAVAAAPARGMLPIVGCLLLLGAYYAMTDGVLMALASSVLPSSARASGLAFLTTLISLARMCASIGVGALWSRYDAGTAVTAYGAMLVGALLIAAITLRPRRPESVA